MNTFNTFGLSNRVWNYISYIFRKKSKVGRPKKHHPRKIFEVRKASNDRLSWNYFINTLFKRKFI